MPFAVCQHTYSCGCCPPLQSARARSLSTVAGRISGYIADLDAQLQPLGVTLINGHLYGAENIRALTNKQVADAVIAAANPAAALLPLLPPQQEALLLEMDQLLAHYCPAAQGCDPAAAAVVVQQAIDEVEAMAQAGAMADPIPVELLRQVLQLVQEYDQMHQASQAAISQLEPLAALGPVAAFMHDNSVSGAALGAGSSSAGGSSGAGWRGASSSTPWRFGSGRLHSHLNAIERTIGMFAKMMKVPIIDVHKMVECPNLVSTAVGGY